VPKSGGDGTHVAGEVSIDTARLALDEIALADPQTSLVNRPPLNSTDVSKTLIRGGLGIGNR
jgi:hypothetical protein